MKVIQTALMMPLALGIAGCTAQIDALQASETSATSRDRAMFPEMLYEKFEMPGEYVLVKSVLSRSSVEKIVRQQMITYGALVQCASGNLLGASFRPQVEGVSLAEHDKVDELLSREPGRRTFVIKMLMFVEARYAQTPKCLTFKGGAFVIGPKIMSARTPVHD